VLAGSRKAKGESTVDAVRLGVVGIGALALRGILPHLAQDDLQGRVRLQALCDPVTERAEAAARQYSVPQCFARLEDLLEEGQVDAVTIASPIGLHYEQGLQAIEAGKHVHFNKTMCTTVAEADALIAAAERKDVRIVASPGEVLRPQLQRVRELIASEKAIGELCWALCGCEFGHYHEQEQERSAAAGGQPIDPSWYFRKPGGGPMYDVTVYPLHRLTSVLGPAQRVTALSGQSRARREFLGRKVEATADDNTIVTLDFGSSVFAVAYGAAAGPKDEDFGSVSYFGTDGTIRGWLLNERPFDFPGRELTLGGPTWDWDAQARALPHVVGVHGELPEAHVFEDIMQLIDWVRDGVPSAATAEHARHVIDIIESAYRASETERTQTLRTTFSVGASRVLHA
jgi:predicted dehydrogenase